MTCMARERVLGWYERTWRDWYHDHEAESVFPHDFTAGRLRTLFHILGQKISFTYHIYECTITTYERCAEYLLHLTSDL